MNASVRCREVLGNINDPSYEILLRRRLGGFFEVDEVVLDGDTAARGRFAARTASGAELVIDLEAPGLTDGDVLATVAAAGTEPARAVVVRLASAEALRIVAAGDPLALARACWEVGNMHAPLFEGTSSPGRTELLTPANPVLERMLSGVPGIEVATVRADLDPARRFSSKAADVVVGLASDFTIVRRAEKGR